MANKKFVLIMYMLLIIFSIGLARTVIFNIYVYGLKTKPPAYELLFIGDEKLIGAIEEQFDAETLKEDRDDKQAVNKNRSVKWDYFFQQGTFFNSLISSMASYNEALINLPRVSGTDANGKKVYNNNEASNIYDLGDGYLVNIIEDRDNAELVHQITDFKSFLDEEEIEYIFFLAPGKISRPEESGMPFFLNNHSNENADDLLDKLSVNNIHTFDLRDDFEKEEDYRSFFYKNDHHWNNKGALLAAKYSAREICNYAGIDYDESLYDINNYDCYSYDNRFYGSMIGDSSMLIEKNQKSDFVLYLPKFRTDYSSTSIYGDNCVDGTIDELFCNWEELDNQDKDDETIYKVYGIGDNGAIRNNLVHNDYKVLVLADSYGNSYAPYLALQFREIRRINLRSYQEGIKDYIIKEKPDMVIQINDQDNNWFSSDYPEELWDFQ